MTGLFITLGVVAVLILVILAVLAIAGRASSYDIDAATADFEARKKNRTGLVIPEALALAADEEVPT